MEILTINSGAADTDEATARATRNALVRDGKGAAIVRAGDDAEPRHLLEKIILGVALPVTGVPHRADRLPWKPGATVILVGEGAEIFLDTFEELAPGFKAMFGEPRTI
jgi:hypothetical protein